MKIKTLLFILTIILFGFKAKAGTVSYEDALHKALSFLHCTDKQASISMFSLSGKADMYKVVTNNGWVLLSSERSIKPVLAYSYEETFPDIEDMPDGMKWLFSYYEDAIAHVRQHPNEYNNINAWDDSCDEFTDTRETVCLTRLGEVKWGQCLNNSLSCIKSYNKFCPTFHDVCCGGTYAGCGAVALGQVLWFYQWPHAALIPTQMLNDNGQVSSTNSCKFYDWNLMPEAIYHSTTSNQADEVAALLRDCGYAAHMQYKRDASYTNVVNLTNALRENFEYTEVYYRDRASYNGNWVELMKSEIRNGHPVIYRGAHPTKSNSSIGHFFILYGFENNHFMINWGWQGSGNSTFYTLDSLFINGSHYNDGQYAILNIQPTYPACHSLFVSPLEHWTTNFLVQNGGGITVQNKIITSGMQGGIFSGDYVRLNGPVRITQGASVVIGIRDMHCDDRDMLFSPEHMEASTFAPSSIQDNRDIPSVKKVFRNGQLLILREGKTYSITGQKVE